MRLTRYSVLALMIAVGSACAPAAPSQPRVLFLEPQEGATVKSPVHLKFGIENYQVAAVPPGTVETARAGMGHYHVAVDSECLAAGTTIEKAAPWVHFGDGKADIDMQLPPGRHKLTLQLGDDLHRAVDSLCTSISVNVSE